MARLLLHDLSPGRTYNVQVRATNGTIYSDWSPLFTFETIGDTMPPAAPTGLTWDFIGTALAATWIAPTTNQDGTPLLDLRDYQVTLTAGGINVVYYTASTRFDMTFEENRNAFGGIPRPTVAISVKARDNTGNLSAAITASATNPPPAQPTGFAATGLNEAIGVSWNANTESDLDHYEINMSTTSGFTPGPGNIVWSGRTTNATIVTAANYATEYLAICAVDVFGSKSTYATASATPKSSFVVDLTPPATPTGLTVVANPDADPSGSRITATVSWTMASPPSDLAGFKIRYQKSGDTNWSYFDVTDGSALSATIVGLSANVAYNFQISAYDFSDNQSAYTAVVSLSAYKDTTAPGTPSAPTAIVGTQSIQVYHAMTLAAGGNLPIDMDYFEVYVSPTANFTPTKATDATNNYVGNLSVTPPFAGNIVPAIGTFTVPAKRSSDTDTSTSKTYYVKVIAVDSSGNRSTASAQATASVGLIDNLSIGNAVITSANIHDVTADKITAGSGFINDLSVYSTFTLGSSSTDGVIQSYDFSSSGGRTGFKLAKSGLVIKTGTIAAAALQIKAGDNIIPPQYADFEFQPSYYTGMFVTSGSPTVNADQSSSKINSQSLFIGAGATSPTVDFTPSATTYNIPAEPNTTYIVSAYIRHNSAANQNIFFRFKDDAGVAVQISPAIVIPSSPAWTRVYTTFTSNGGTGSGAWIGIQTPASTNTWVDGVQVEAQIGSIATPSSWRPSSTTTIDGGMIKTGSIQSTVTTTTGTTGTPQPMWAIPMNGSATFANLFIRGHAIIGDTGNTSDQWLSSGNYSAGSAGWIIKGDGSAELNNVTVRGTIVATGSSTIPGSSVSGSVANATSATSASNSSNLTGGTISGTNSVAGSIQSGYPSGSAHVEFNSNGFFAYNSAGTNMVSISSTGDAWFWGTVTANGPIRSASGNTRVEMNSTNYDQLLFINNGAYAGTIRASTDGTNPILALYSGAGTTDSYMQLYSSGMTLKTNGTLSLNATNGIWLNNSTVLTKVNTADLGSGFGAVMFGVNSWYPSSWNGGYRYQAGDFVGATAMAAASFCGLDGYYINTASGATFIDIQYPGTGAAAINRSAGIRMSMDHGSSTADIKQVSLYATSGAAYANAVKAVLSVTDTSYANTYQFQSNGYAYAYMGWSTTSDIRMKTDVKSAPTGHGKDIIRSAKSKHWRFAHHDDIRFGPMAQDLPSYMVGEVDNTLRKIEAHEDGTITEIKIGPDRVLSVNPMDLIGALWHAVGELIDEVEELKKKP